MSKQYNLVADLGIEYSVQDDTQFKSDTPF